MKPRPTARHRMHSGCNIRSATNTCVRGLAPPLTQPSLSQSLIQPYFGSDALPAKRADGDLVTALVTGLVPAAECQCPLVLHAHRTAQRLCAGLPLVLGYAALQHHLAYCLGAGLQRACRRQRATASDTPGVRQWSRHHMWILISYMKQNSCISYMKQNSCKVLWTCRICHP